MPRVKTTTAADPTRVSNIAGQIRAAVSPVSISGQDNDEAKDAAKEASEENGRTREATFIALADLAHTGQWTNDEIEAAAAAAVAQSKVQGHKALATYIGEAKVAMRPGVRSQVSRLLDLRNTVWQEEEDLKAADPQAGTLFKDAFKRKQHMLNAMMNETNAGRALVTASDVVAFAKNRLEEQRLDTDKILKKINKLSSELTEVYRDYQHEDLAAAIGSLSQIDVGSLDKVKRDAVVATVDHANTTVVDMEVEVEDTRGYCDPNAPAPEPRGVVLNQLEPEAHTEVEAEVDPFDVLNMN
jgi:hypothetical protein